MKKFLLSVLLAGILAFSSSAAVQAKNIQATNDIYYDNTHIVAGSYTADKQTGNKDNTFLQSIGTPTALATLATTGTTSIGPLNNHSQGDAAPLALTVDQNSSATFTFSGTVTSLSFTWNSLPQSTTVTLRYTDNTTTTLSGQALLDAFQGVANGNDDIQFALTTALAIKSITFAVGDVENNCEKLVISNMKVSSVPLPGALGLFAPALLGLAGLRRKKSI